MALSVVLTLAFVAGEATAGYLSHSLALFSDAGHNFADALALLLSWYGLRVARRPATARRTYGFHRVGILAALVNAGSLVAIALAIFWEAVLRLRAPQPVSSGLMIGTAAVAVVLNGLISVWLRREASTDLNIRSAYLHMLGDAVSAVGVVVAGVVVAVTGATIADPIVSMLIGALILWSSWAVLTEAVDVLLEAAPAGLDTRKVEETLLAVEGVREVHDLHVWTVGPGVTAASCHILVSDVTVQHGQEVLRLVSQRLADTYGITHSTVQIEVEGHEAPENCPAAQP